MYPPSEPPVDPLGLPPAPAAPTVPVAPTPKQMNPIIQSLLTAAAAMAGPGRGTGILQGLNLSQQQATQAAEQQHLRNQQDYARQVQAYQTEEQAWQRQQTQRAAMLQKVLTDFQSELANTSSDAEAEQLYQSAAQVLQAQGFRGFDVASLKRKYHSPTAQERAGKVVDKFLSGAAAKQTLENDPEALNSTYIDLGNGVMVPFQQAQAMSGRAPLKGKPKSTPAGSLTPREGVVNGKSVFFTMGADGTPQVVQGVSPTPPATKEPAPRAKVPVMRNGALTWVEQGGQQPGDLPYSAAGQTPKEPSQGQYATAGYAARIQQAESILSKLEGDISKMGQMSFSAQSASPTAKLQSGTFQSYDQAARNFINAVLRRESGAAISPSEFDNARRQYLPMPGDTPETLAQKRANRELVFSNLKSASGPAYEPPPDAGVTDAKKSAQDKLKGRP